jgi:hypothetical protein
LVLSFRIKLTAQGLPEDTYNCRLRTVNILACVFNVAIPAIVWIYNMINEEKAAEITYDVEQLSLALSCICLVWGICRLVRIVQSLVDKMVNKVMIFLHIFA